MLEKILNALLEGVYFEQKFRIFAWTWNFTKWQSPTWNFSSKFSDCTFQEVREELEGRNCLNMHCMNMA